MIKWRYNHTATLLPDGTVLLVGGDGWFATGLSPAEIYTPSTGTFTITGTMYEPRSSHVAVLLPNGAVFNLGGSGLVIHNESGSPTAEFYLPATGTFTPLSSMGPVGTGRTATVLMNGTVLIAGGSFQGVPVSSAELYLP